MFLNVRCFIYIILDRVSEILLILVYMTKRVKSFTRNFSVHDRTHITYR